MKKIACLLVVATLFLWCFVSPAYSSDSFEQGSKMTEDLLSLLEEMDQDAEIDVVIALFDVDDAPILDYFANSYPDEYSSYYSAKYEESNALTEATGESNPVDVVQLQRAISIKRYLYAQAYFVRNKGFIDKYADISKQIFVSKYSPMVIATLTKEKIFEAEMETDVVSIERFIDDEAVAALSNTNNLSGVATVKNLGYTGNNINVGIIEKGLPYYNVITNGSTGTTDDRNHATCVAAILIDSADGVSPDVSLYAASTTTLSGYYSKIEWLLDPDSNPSTSDGVNIINSSIGFYSDAGKYDTLCSWVDHIANKHDVHFVCVAGNKDQNQNNYLIIRPGMAYNAITVGGFYDKNNTLPTDDERYADSLYVEYASSARAEKPNIIANAQSVTINSLGLICTGTSFAAPQVAGVIAQICSINGNLLVRQTEVGAILSAGSIYKLEGETLGHNYCKFETNVSVPGCRQISIFEGAGKLNAIGAKSIVSAGTHYKATIQADDFPYTKTISISANQTKPTRIAIFWLRRTWYNSGEDHLDTSSLHSAPLSNLTLKVYAPDGSLVGSSYTSYSNYEIVQFYPQQTGTYSIVISKVTPNTSSKEYVGIAVW